jgi:hypothetical protein
MAFRLMVLSWGARLGVQTLQSRATAEWKSYVLEGVEIIKPMVVEVRKNIMFNMWWKGRRRSRGIGIERLQLLQLISYLNVIK